MLALKEQFAGVENLVRERAPIWQQLLGLDHFDVEHVFLDSFFGDDGEEDFKVTATTEVRWNYMQAKIKWYLPSCVRHDEATLEKTLVHELCHVLLSPEQALVDCRVEEEGAALSSTEKSALEARYYERMELATEMTTRALLKVYERNRGGD